MTLVDANGRDTRSGRLRVHPALLQLAAALAIFIGSLVAGYYSGKAEQAQKTSDLGSRVSVLETRTDTLRDDVREMKNDLKELLRRTQ